MNYFSKPFHIQNNMEDNSMRNYLVTWPVLILLSGIVAIGCGTACAAAPAFLIQVADDSGETDSKELEKFEAWAKEFFDEPHTDVLLPDAKQWFLDRFEVETAERLTTEYLAQAKGVEGLVQFIEKTKADGKTELRVSAFSKAIDMTANGLQNAALQRMKKSTTLFKLEMRVPGEDAGTSLWSFVLEDGNFRFAGKMTALNPTRGDMIADVLCQLPLENAETLLKGNGMLEKSAVEYLKEKGILK